MKHTEVIAQNIAQSLHFLAGMEDWNTTLEDAQEVAKEAVEKLERVYWLVKDQQEGK